LDEPGQLAAVLGLVLCLLGLAAASAVDAAFTAISRNRFTSLLATFDVRTSARVTRLLDEPFRFKSTILLLNITQTTAAAALTAWLVRPLDLLSTVAVLAGLVLVLVFVTEILPKALAVRSPERTARLLTGPLVVVTTVMRPLLLLLDLISRPVVTVLSGKPAASTPLVTSEELRMLVNVGSEEGLIQRDEREMIEDVMAFGDTVVREIMVPRVDIIALEEHAGIDQALDLAVTRGHSRIPVYRESVDTIIGILYAKDLIPVLRDGRRDLPLTELLRPPHFVPVTMKVAALLEDLQRRRVHMAIVVDEYGGTAGMATLEDLIEQIVGEIRDEYDQEEPQVNRISAHEVIVDARVPIDDVADLLGAEFPHSSADRIGGLVYERLGRIPRVGDHVLCNDIRIEVLSVKGIRADRLHLLRGRPVESDAEPEDEVREPVTQDESEQKHAV
jgi:putative hemolysin